jgi:hypothetical protein
MAQSSKRYLKIGDHIVFYSETGDEEGFISIDSKTDDQCIIKNTKDKGKECPGQQITFRIILYRNKSIFIANIRAIIPRKYLRLFFLH